MLAWAGAIVSAAVTSGCASAPSGGGSRPPAPAPPAVALAADDSLPMLLLLEDRRLFEPTLVGRAIAGAEHERVAAATTLGRLGDPRGEQALLLLLRDEAVAVRRAAAHALRGSATSLAVDALLLATADLDRETATRAVRALAAVAVPLERLARAMAGLQEDEIWFRLVPSLSLFPETARRELVAVGLEEAPAELRDAIALAALHTPSAASLPLVRDLLDHPDPFVRGYAARALGELGAGPGDLARLEALFDDRPFTASEALVAADRLLGDGRAAPPAAWGAALLARLEGMPNGADAKEPTVESEAAATSGSSAATDRADAAVAVAHPDVHPDGHPDVEVALCGLLRHFVYHAGVSDALVAVARGGRDPATRGAAIGSLLWAAESRAFDLLGELAAARGTADRARAAALLGEGAWPLSSLVPLLALLDRLLEDEAARVRAAAIRASFARAELIGLAALQARALAARADPSGAVRAELYSQLAERPVVGLDALVASVGARLEREPDPVARRQLVRALATRGAAERLERGAIIALLERVADEDPSHLVRVRAAEGLAQFGRTPPVSRPVHSLDQVGAYREVALRTGEARTVILRTSRGDVVLRLECPLAPKTCLSFLQLAAQGFYRGQEILDRRLGRGLVAGDPTGTGWGGPGYRLRDELTPLELDAPGVLVIERPFVDGAASRFELTLSPQPWRSGSEVALGRVVGGLELLDQLRAGDHIMEVLVQGDELPGSKGAADAAPARRP